MVMKVNKQFQYEQLARRTLSILNISFDDTASLEKLIEIIDNAIVLPASSTELNIQRLSKDIATQLKSKGRNDYIEKLIEQLESEVNYLPFD